MPAAHRTGPATLRPLEKRLAAADFPGVLSSTPSVLARLVGRIPMRRTAGGRIRGAWSPPDILWHLADTEAVMSFRIRKILCEQDPDLSFFDQDRWAEGLRPLRSASPSRALAVFRTLRKENLALLASAGPDRMRRTGVHPESGRMTLEELAARMARHDVNHLRQLLGG